MSVPLISASASEHGDNRMSEPELVHLELFVRNQFPYLQGSINHADQKAGFMLVIVIALLGYLEGKGAISACSFALQNRQLQNLQTDILALLSVFFLSLSGIAAVYVVWPRFRRDIAPLTAWAGMATHHKTPGSYAEAVLKASPESRYRQHLEHHFLRSKYCWKKWWGVRGAFVFYVIGFISSVAYILAKG